MHPPQHVLGLYPPHAHTLDTLLRSRARAQPLRPFLRMTGHTWSWQAFEEGVLGMQAWLASRGIASGDRVAIVARNHPAHLFLLLALARLGAILVPVNPDFKQAELAYILAHCAPAGVFAGTEQQAPVRAALGHASAWVVELAASDDGLAAFMRLLSTPPAPPARPASPDDTCVLIYTSGTTGFPKGVMHSQRTLARVGDMSVARVRLQPTDVVYVVLPLFHINALFYSVLGALAAGAQLVVRERFSASRFWDDIHHHRVTQVNVLESVALILAARPRSEYRSGHALRVVYGVRPNAARVFREDFQVPCLVSGYGMSEIPGFLCHPYGGPDKPGSMGLPARHPDPALDPPLTRVVDDDGRDVCPGETGELRVRTPVIMQGYFGDPGQTRAAFVDGWFATGDLVRQDDEGYFYFVARKKDIIRRRGENISAAELDRTLGEHPGIAQAAVAGIPSDMGDEDILAAIVPRPGATLDPFALADWCHARLAAQKVPRHIVLVDRLPMNATHKVMRKTLRDDPAYLAAATDVSAPRS